jgi:hypothetical protein
MGSGACCHALDAAGDQDSEWVAGLACTDLDADVTEVRLRKQGLELGLREPEVAITEPVADPCLIVLAQIED